MADLFFSRSVDLYLKDKGVIGFVLPHSALQADQYSEWRGGRWRGGNSGLSVQVDFTFQPAWDLEQLKPNTFFPVPSSAVVARKCPADSPDRLLEGLLERWEGKAGAKNVRRRPYGIRDTDAAGESP